jgi:hypothetical protein
MNIVNDDLRHPAVKALLAEHMRGMVEHCPPGSIHSLDLGSGPHASYQKFGFEFCGPFHEYGPDPSSRFMTRRLSQRFDNRGR